MIEMRYEMLYERQLLQAEREDIPIMARVIRGEPVAIIAHKLLTLRAMKELFAAETVPNLDERREYNAVVDQLRQALKEVSHQGRSLSEIVASCSLNPRDITGVSQQDIRDAYHKQDGIYLAELVLDVCSNML